MARKSKEFYRQVINMINDALEKIDGLEGQIEKKDKESKDERWSDDYRRKLQEEVRGMKRELQDTRNGFTESINALCNEYIDELDAEDALDPKQLVPEDVALLRSGITLTRRDLMAMWDRNKDNKTMQQVIVRHCRENNIEEGFTYEGNGQKIQNVKAVPMAADTILRWNHSDNVRENIMGLLADSFDVDE